MTRCPSGRVVALTRLPLERSGDGIPLAPRAIIAITAAPVPDCVEPIAGPASAARSQCLCSSVMIRAIGLIDTWSGPKSRRFSSSLKISQINVRAGGKDHFNRTIDCCRGKLTQCVSFPIVADCRMARIGAADANYGSNRGVTAHDLKGNFSLALGPELTAYNNRNRHSSPTFRMKAPTAFAIALSSVSMVDDIVRLSRVPLYPGDLSRVRPDGVGLLE